MDDVCETSWKQLPYVDVRVDEVEPRQGVLDLVRRLRPHWKLQDVQMKRFTEGITNQLIGCFVGSPQDPGVVLVRLYGRMTELFVDRERELEIFRLFHSHGCGPEIYCSFQNGICYQFVQGEVLDDLRLHQPTIYRLIAAELGKIHSIKPRGGGPVQPCLWNKMSHFLSLLQENICSAQQQGRSAAELCWLPSIHTLAAEMEALKTHLSQLDSPTVLCHNDLLTKNIIYNHSEGGVKFIDYEYADYNYQAFDIGNHFNEFAGVNEVDYSRYPDMELQRDWLQVYLQSYRRSSGQDAAVTDADVLQLYVQVCKFSLASNFLWALWAILQWRFSSIDFDFKRYALARLNFYFEKKEQYLELAA